MNQLEDIIEELDIGTLLSTRTISGGSINDSFRVETTEGEFFLKLNSASRLPNMFEAEKRGLELLGQSSFIVPKPLGVGTHGDTQFILMQWVEKGAPEDGFWNEFGRSLAELHLLSSVNFGLNHDNYIGSLNQKNSEHENWADFYRDERLIPQMNLADKQGRLSQRMRVGFETLFLELESLFPVEKPSLLHGDLWSGNMMVTADGSPSIFDPAVYFGHREMDLAMMALFGGFGNGWIDAYNEVYPLESGWRERIPIGQLYPLMIHVNLFGGGYVTDVLHALKQF